MPNWCRGTVEVVGQIALTDRLLREVPGFDLDVICPVPEALRNLEAESDGRVFRVRESGDATRRVLVSHAEKHALMAEFGSLSEWDWRRDNWGTAYDAEAMTWVRSGATISAAFECPWSPPVPVVVELSKRYADVCFVVRYSSFASDYGWAVIADGELLHQGWFTYTAEEVYGEDSFTPGRNELVEFEDGQPL